MRESPLRFVLFFVLFVCTVFLLLSWFMSGLSTTFNRDQYPHIQGLYLSNQTMNTRFITYSKVLSGTIVVRLTF